MVIAFHAMTAYIAFISQHSFALDAPPYLWRAFPIVDQQRFFGFDLFCAWLNVFLMSFFYLLSGLFVWSSLSRKGPTAFLQDRLLRLGLPFAAVVLLLMPPTLYRAMWKAPAIRRSPGTGGRGSGCHFAERPGLVSVALDPLGCAGGRDLPAGVSAWRPLLRPRSTHGGGR